MKINEDGFQGRYLSKVICEEIHYDYDFMKGVEDNNREHGLSAFQKSYRDKIFNSKTSVIFINALD